MQSLPAAFPLARLRTAASRRGPVPGKVMVHVDRLLDRGRRRSWQQVADQLCRLPPTRISVDVFDTVLTRTIVGDESVWWATAAELTAIDCWSGTPDDFVAARRDAALAGPQDDLRALYLRPELAAGTSCPDVAQYESRIEAQLARPVDGAREALARLRTAGHRLTFVSDMHLGHADLWASLLQHGLAVADDSLVVSSDVGASKSSGELFPLLVSRPDPPTWHVGNDLWSDVAMAERAGLLAMPIRAAETSPLEQVMAGPTGSVGSAVAGAARVVRTRGATLPAPQAALVEVGADVAGQCLGAFLLWAREECERAELRQLCFLARDGELPMRMAQAMPADHWRGLELTYVHGSRRLWSAASVAVVGVDAWLAAGTGDDAGFLRQNQHSIPFRSLLARALLGPEDLEGHASLQALPDDEPLPEHLDGAWRALLADDRVREQLHGRALRQFEHLTEYLRSDGIGTVRVGVLDVGWRGQLAWQVSAVLRAVTGYEPVHLHFGGVDVAVEAEADIRRFAVDDSRAPLPFPDVISCVETLTASGAARARATERNGDGEVRLVFDEALPDMDTEQRRLMWRRAVDVATLLPPREDILRWGLRYDGLGDSATRVLSSFWLSPTRLHARAGAQLASEVDDAGHSVLPVARAYGLADLGGPGASSRTWRQGSLRLTPQPFRSMVRWALHCKDGQDASRVLAAPPDPSDVTRSGGLSAPTSTAASPSVTKGA